MKDPAFLFYSNDFLSGTMLMTDEETGQYIKLLCLQHQKGHLKEKDMLNICKSYNEEIFSKFKKDKDENYYSKRGSKGKKEEEKIHFAEFVSMTNAEHEKLVSTYGKDFADQCILVLDNYKGSSGKTYKNDYRAILNWVVDKVKQSYKAKPSINYDYKGDDTL